MSERASGRVNVHAGPFPGQRQAAGPRPGRSAWQKLR